MFVSHDRILFGGRLETEPQQNVYGVGKTTTIRMLLGLVRPASGDGMILGGSLGEPATYLHRTENGADAIIALRCREASSQWEAICGHRNNQTGAA